MRMRIRNLVAIMALLCASTAWGGATVMVGTNSSLLVSPSNLWSANTVVTNANLVSVSNLLQTLNTTVSNELRREVGAATTNRTVISNEMIRLNGVMLTNLYAASNEMVRMDGVGLTNLFATSNEMARLDGVDRTNEAAVTLAISNEAVRLNGSMLTNLYAASNEMVRLDGIGTTNNAATSNEAVRLNGSMLTNLYAASNEMVRMDGVGMTNLLGVSNIAANIGTAVSNEGVRLYGVGLTNLYATSNELIRLDGISRTNIAASSNLFAGWGNHATNFYMKGTDDWSLLYLDANTNCVVLPIGGAGTYLRSLGTNQAPYWTGLNAVATNVGMSDLTNAVATNYVIVGGGTGLHAVSAAWFASNYVPYVPSNLVVHADGRIVMTGDLLVGSNTTQHEVLGVSGIGYYTNDTTLFYIDFANKNLIDATGPWKMNGTNIADQTWLLTEIDNLSNAEVIAFATNRLLIDITNGIDIVDLTSRGTNVINAIIAASNYTSAATSAVVVVISASNEYMYARATNDAKAWTNDLASIPYVTNAVTTHTNLTVAGGVHGAGTIAASNNADYVHTAFTNNTFLEYLKIGEVTPTKGDLVLDVNSTGYTARIWAYGGPRALTLLSDYDTLYVDTLSAGTTSATFRGRVYINPLSDSIGLEVVNGAITIDGTNVMTLIGATSNGIAVGTNNLMIDITNGIDIAVLTSLGTNVIAGIGIASNRLNAIGNIGGTSTNGAAVDDFLKWDGTNWLPAVPAGGGDFMADGSVAMTGPLDGGGQVGTNFVALWIGDTNIGTTLDAKVGATVTNGLLSMAEAATLYVPLTITNSIPIYLDEPAVKLYPIAKLAGTNTYVEFEGAMTVEGHAWFELGWGNASTSAITVHTNDILLSTTSTTFTMTLGQLPDKWLLLNITNLGAGSSNFSLNIGFTSK